MYVRTENDEAVEVLDFYYYPLRTKIIEHRDGYYSELYKKLYCDPKVKPVEGKSSWQLYLVRLNDGGGMGIATFDTVKEANKALRAFKTSMSNGGGWDAIEYKNEMSEQS